MNFLGRVQTAFLAASLASGASHAQTIQFKDKSGFDNFVVVISDGDGREYKAETIEDGFSIDLSDYEAGELITVGIRFFVPNEKGSENFTVQNAETMQINILISVPNGGSSRKLTVPVYYLDSIGRRGFEQIETIQANILDRAFEQFFKAALMAEHYRLKLGGKDTGPFRRSLRIWREGNVAVSQALPEWFRMHSDIVFASEEAFGQSSNQHEDTIKRFEEINR